MIFHHRRKGQDCRCRQAGHDSIQHGAGRTGSTDADEVVEAAVAGEVVQRVTCGDDAESHGFYYPKLRV